jgi:hypothetical protein
MTGHGAPERLPHLFDQRKGRMSEVQADFHRHKPVQANQWKEPGTEQ